MGKILSKLYTTRDFGTFLLFKIKKVVDKTQDVDERLVNSDN